MKYEFSGKNLVNFWNKNLGGGNEKEFSENSVYESCKGWQESAEKEIKSYTTSLETIGSIPVLCKNNNTKIFKIFYQQ